MSGNFLVYTIFTMLLIFFTALIGIGLVLEIALSSFGLPLVGITIGICIGLYVDYNIYREYIDDKRYNILGA